ncbi:MAG: C10 family peptidase [Lentisphaeraceae bacterium]|nr:C10 family peptidase [Lentisphaeraceae bacterium]
MNLKLCFLGGTALAAAVTMAGSKDNTWRPTWTAIEPLCAATDWDQEGALNAYVGYDATGTTWQNNACGCDPLAWGQVVVYHALNHGFPAAGWEPMPVTGRVYFGTNDQTGVERTTMSGPYDWVAIRDKVWEKDGEDKTLSCPVGRLMWDLGIIGNARYGYNTLATCWSYDSTNDATIYTYFNYGGKGYRYTKPVVNEALQPYWREMLRTLLRTSLQAGAPVVTSITSSGGHMVVTDGYGVDADGKEWFHIDYAWQDVKGYWWDLDEFVSQVNALYAFTYPTDLGGVITGRVTTPTGAPVAGATLVLSNGTEARVTTTDAAGAYCFSGLTPLSDEGVTAEDLPRMNYTVTVLAESCEDATQCVTLAPYIDDDRRSEKQDAAEEALGKDVLYTFPLVIGSAVADFTVTPRRFFAPGATGSGRSWADPAALTVEAVAAAAGCELFLAQGSYAFTEALTLPAGTTLSGGYNPATGLANPLATPSVLNFQTEENLEACITLSANSELRGLSLTFSTSDKGEAQALLFSDSALADKPQVIGVSFPAYSAAYKYAANLALTCCTFACDTGSPRCINCTFLHCSFYDKEYNDTDATDLGGNRFGVTSGSWRPESALPCPDKAKHTCPELGLDGRPLNQTQGALAPVGGYTLSLQ